MANAPRQEFFIRIFKSAVALLVSRQIIFCVSAQDVQSSCTKNTKGHECLNKTFRLFNRILYSEIAFLVKLNWWSPLVPALFRVGDHWWGLIWLGIWLEWDSLRSLGVSSTFVISIYVTTSNQISATWGPLLAEIRRIWYDTFVCGRR